MATAVGSSTSTTGATTSGTTGLNSLNGNDFLKVMIAQLQQQDPLNPQDSNQMLTQLSQIKSLESNDNLNTTLSGLSLQSSVAGGSNLIGKMVNGVGTDGSQVTGKVNSITVANNIVSLQLDDGTALPLANVTAVAPATATTGATTTGNTTTGTAGT